MPYDYPAALNPSMQPVVNQHCDAARVLSATQTAQNWQTNTMGFNAHYLEVYRLTGYPHLNLS